MGINQSKPATLQILKVSKNTTAHKANLLPFIHFIITVNNMVITSPADVKKLSEEWKTKDLNILIFDVRTLKQKEILLPKKEEDNGLGISVKLHLGDPFIICLSVLEVHPESPAFASGLVPEQDFIIGIENVYLKDEEEFFFYIHKKRGEAVTLIVFNKEMKNLRRVNCVIGEDPDNILGCEFGSGILHQLPNEEMDLKLDYEIKIENTLKTEILETEKDVVDNLGDKIQMEEVKEDTSEGIKDTESKVIKTMENICIKEETFNKPEIFEENELKIQKPVLVNIVDEEIAVVNESLNEEFIEEKGDTLTESKVEVVDEFLFKKSIDHTQMTEDLVKSKEEVVETSAKNTLIYEKMNEEIAEGNEIVEETSVKNSPLYEKINDEIAEGNEIVVETFVENTIDLGQMTEELVEGNEIVVETFVENTIDLGQMTEELVEAKKNVDEASVKNTISYEQINEEVAESKEVVEETLVKSTFSYEQMNEEITESKEVVEDLQISSSNYKPDIDATDMSSVNKIDELEECGAFCENEDGKPDFLETLRSESQSQVLKPAKSNLLLKEEEMFYQNERPRSDEEYSSEMNEGIKSTSFSDPGNASFNKHSGILCDEIFNNSCMNLNKEGEEEVFIVGEGESVVYNKKEEMLKKNDQ